MKNRAAFTLIELLITVGVIVLMLGMSLPAFTNFQKEQDLITATQIIRDAILETNNYALAPRGDEDPSGGKYSGADYYRIIFYEDSGVARYQIDEQSNSETNFNQVQWLAQPVRSARLPSSIRFCSFEPTALQASDDNPSIDRTGGIIYSIRSLGKIVKPSETGIFTIVIRHIGLATAKVIEVQAETGQVNVSDSTASC